MKLNPWWIVGFADGESTFRLNEYRRRYNRTYSFCWRLQLRADDIAILRKIRRQLGGKLYLIRKRYPSSSRRARPSASLVLHRREELVALVRLFDRYSLQTKKRKDYRIWREALLFWIDSSDAYRQRGRRPKEQTLRIHKQMHKYFLKIKKVRVYREVR